jgi:hypothetical protein
MTTAIHREPRLQRMLFTMGLVLALGIATATAFWMVRPNDSAGDGAALRPAPAATNDWAPRFRSIQDGYNTPRSILAERAKLGAYLIVQDGYLPPTLASPTSWTGAFVAMQDGLLPPGGWSPTREATADSIVLGAAGPQ